MKTTCLLFFSLVLLFQSIALSQIAPTTTIGYVEGPVREITYNPDGTATMLVQNVTVHVPADCAIDSLTTSHTVRQLCIRNRLPGRGEPCFPGSSPPVNGLVARATQRFPAQASTWGRGG